METKEKWRVLPLFSNRTLLHPSFMSLYAPSGSCQGQGDNQATAVRPMSPQEFFYTDRTMVRRPRRIPNHVSELRDFDRFQLNTPPPIMSASPAPPNCPDPFRTGQHLTRNLGSPSCQMDSKLSSTSLRVVIQLTEMEDQTITSLLKLHHEEEKLPTQQTSKVEETLVDSNDSIFPKHNSGDEANALFSNGAHPIEADFGKLDKYWSDTELEVANSLISQFSLNEQVEVSRFSNLLLSGVKQEPTNFTDLLFNKRVLSEPEGDALCMLLSLHKY